MMNDATAHLIGEVMLAQLQQETLSIEEVVSIHKELLTPSTDEWLETVTKQGDHWQAQLFSYCKGTACQFYRECVNKKCRSEQEAQIVIEYGKNIARINRISNDLLNCDAVCWN
jgi:cobyric acid synthase